MLNVIVVIVVSLMCGFVVGAILGFSFAAHPTILEGARPRTNSRIVLFLARPTSELDGAELVLFAVTMLLWAAVLFGLCGLPFYLHSMLMPGSRNLLIASICTFIVVTLLSTRLGRSKWLSLTRHAA